MSNNITIGNLITIGDMKFHDIEGGFGKDKRATLVKEIAEIHGKEIKYINKQINANRKHFTDGKDILDLAGTEFAVHLMNSGIYTVASPARAHMGTVEFSDRRNSSIQNFVAAPVRVRVRKPRGELNLTHPRGLRRKTQQHGFSASCAPLC